MIHAIHTLTLHFTDGTKSEHEGSLDKLLAVLNAAAMRDDFEDFGFSVDKKQAMG